jgi:hypothetical protein
LVLTELPAHCFRRRDGDFLETRPTGILAFLPQDDCSK